MIILAPLTVILAGGLVAGLAALRPEMFRNNIERTLFAVLGFCGVAGGCIALAGLL